MELNFTELDNLNGQNINNNNYDYLINTNSEKYWEQPKEHNKEQTKKKKVSFNDILNNMSLSVNKAGVLQFITPKEEHEEHEENIYEPLNQDHTQPSYQNQNYYKNNVNNINNINNINNFYQIQKQNPIKDNTPIDPVVKHSHIYNKYFKDYQTKFNEEPVIRVPKTMEEYKQMLLEDKLKKIEQQKRISEIKSTKLIFTTNPVAQITGQQNIGANKNSLRRMNFA
jgi:hypothetical protein